MMEAYFLMPNLTSCGELILTVRFECSQIFRFYALHRIHLQASTILLNKKYSRYDGSEVIQRVLSPSKLNKYMFKNSELCHRMGHVQVVAPIRRALHTASGRRALEIMASGSNYSHFD